MRPRADREDGLEAARNSISTAANSLEMTSEIGLGDVIDAGRQIVDGRVRGRIVVKIG